MTLDDDEVLVRCEECAWKGVRCVPAGFWESAEHPASYLFAEFGWCPDCGYSLCGDIEAMYSYQTTAVGSGA